MTRSGSILGRVIGGLEVHGVAMRWEGVHCECADAECGCSGACTALACYCWGGVAEGNWQYLCHRCGLRLVERGTAEAGKPVEGKLPEQCPQGHSADDSELTAPAGLSTDVEANE